MKPGSLKHTDLDRLAAYLDDHAVPDDGMSFEMLDGYLHAVVIGPETILPSEWLPRLWSLDGSKDHVWKDLDEARDINELIMRHMNSIARALRTGQGDWTPMLDEFEKNGRVVSYGQEWAMGLLRGIELRRPQWQPMIDDPDFADGFDAVLLLANGPDDSALGRKVRTQYQRDKLIDKMLDFVERASIYWLDRYKPPAPIRRTQPKVGRNDPCPCGSGKKFKHCCGTATTVH